MDRIAQLQAEWRSLHEQERKAIEAGDQRMFQQVAYRRRALPLEIVNALQERGEARLAQLEQERISQEREARALLTQIRAKREKIDALFRELEPLEQRYAQLGFEAEEPAAATLLARHELPLRYTVHGALMGAVREVQSALERVEQLRRGVLAQEPRALEQAQALLESNTGVDYGPLHYLLVE